MTTENVHNLQTAHEAHQKLIRGAAIRGKIAAAERARKAAEAADPTLYVPTHHGGHAGFGYMPKHLRGSK